MSTEIPFGDIQLFYDYLGRRLARGAVGLSPETSVEEFRAYQSELNRFMQETQRAEQESLRGEATPLDLDALKQRVVERLANEG